MLFDSLLFDKKGALKKSVFRDILLNQYGNYTIYTLIYKAFEHPNQKYVDYFIKIFRENTESLRKVNFGKKFINKVDTLIK